MVMAVEAIAVVICSKHRDTTVDGARAAPEAGHAGQPISLTRRNARKKVRGRGLVRQRISDPPMSRPPLQPYRANTSSAILLDRARAIL
jgi:hypothetical protein